jgi:hypothetical protein
MLSFNHLLWEMLALLWRSHGDPCDHEFWRLGAGRALTVLQFAQLCGCARVLGFSTNLERVLG